MSHPISRTLIDLYARLAPDQRAAIARQFITSYRQLPDPTVRQFATLDPDQATPEQLAAMHLYAREHDRGLLEDVLAAPAALALGAMGAVELEHELDEQPGY